MTLTNLTPVQTIINQLNAKGIPFKYTKDLIEFTFDNFKFQVIHEFREAKFFIKHHLNTGNAYGPINAKDLILI